MVNECGGFQAVPVFYVLPAAIYMPGITDDALSCVILYEKIV